MGFFLCCSAHQALKGPSGLGSLSVVPHIRTLKGKPLWGLSLLFWCQCWGVVREARAMAPPPACDSVVLPHIHDCLIFLHRHFPLQYPPLRPLGPSPCSQQQTSPWGCSPISMLQLLVIVLSMGLVSLSRICMAEARRICVILISLRLSQMSYFTLSLKCFSSVPNIIALIWGFDPCFSSPIPQACVLSFSLSSSHPPPHNTSFILLSFAWFYVLFSCGQVLLLALS